MCAAVLSYSLGSLPGFASSPEEPLHPGLVLPPLICSWEVEFELNNAVPVTGGLITAPREKKKERKVEPISESKEWKENVIIFP